MTEQGSNQVAVMGGGGQINVSSISKLTGKNFRTWKEMVSILLELKGLTNVVKNGTGSALENLQAKLVLLESMDDSHKSQVMGCSSARDVMQRVELIYADNSAANAYRLMHRFFRYKKDAADSMAEHIGKMDEMRMALKDIDKDPENDLYQVTLIGSLPSEYEGMLELWELTHQDMRTNANLVSRLLKKESDLKESRIGALAVRRYSSEQWRQLPVSERKKLSKCKQCGKKGHWAAECQETAESKLMASSVKGVGRTIPDAQPDEEQRPGTSKAEQDPILFMVLKQRLIKSKDQWIGDSGASNHMCCNREWFSNLSMYRSPVSCTLGDGNSISVLGVGQVPILTRVEGEERMGILQNVYYMPDLTCNLLSIGAISKQGIVTIFREESCKFVKGQVTVAVGNRLDDGLYLIDIRAKLADPKALILKGTRALCEWHKDLGHPSKERILQLARDLSDMTISDPSSQIDCEHCPEGKGKHSTFQRRQDRAQVVGGKVCVDLSGKIAEKSIEGYSYFMLAKDEFSEYCFVTMLKEKGEAASCIAKLIVEFEVESDHPIRRLQTDQGSEFVNKQTELLMLQEGILHETSPVYTPQQNATVEREMGSLVNMARTLLLASKLPKHLWSLAIEAATYLRNRLPTKNSSKTPYERFHGRKPSVQGIITFGREVHVIKDNIHLTKFEPRTQPGWIVGYTRRRRNYQVFLKQDQKVIETRHVIIAQHGKPIPSDQSSEENVDILYDLDFPQDNKPATPTAPVYDPDLLDRFFKEFRETNLEESKQGDPLPNPLPLPPRERAAGYVPKINYVASANYTRVPNSYLEAVTGEDRDGWVAAIKDQLDALELNDTWRTCEGKNGRDTLKTRWVFAIKQKEGGKMERKARLVVKGYAQRPGLDYYETFAPVASIQAIRVLLSMIAAKGWYITQFDVCTAFLNGVLDEEVFIDFPEGVKVKAGKCLKLHKALYGLKQAPRAWAKRLAEIMQTLECRATQTEPSIFVHSSRKIWVAVYVDDGLIVSEERTACEEIFQKLANQVKIRRVETGVFLGIKISRSSKKIWINQSSYIQSVLERFDAGNSLTHSSPLFNVAEMYQEDEGDETTDKPFRQLIGSLQYCANCTRPDIAFPVNLLAQFSANPKDKHYQAALRVLRYLKQTIAYSIIYQQTDGSIRGYSDANWAGDARTRLSTSGTMIILNHGPVTYQAKKQIAIALSSTEAEYVAASELVRDLLWLTTYLDELGEESSCPIVHIDNQSTIQQIKSNETQRRSRHIDIRYHFVKSSYEENKFKLQHVASEQQLADFLTKILPRKQLSELVHQSGIQEVEEKDMSRGSVLVLLMVMVGSSLELAANNQPYERADAVILSESQCRLDLGVTLYSMIFKYTTPCVPFEDIIAINTEGSGRKTMTQLANEEFITTCNIEHEEGWLPLVEAFSKCQSDGTFDKARRLLKRFVIWFLVAAVIIIFAVSAAITTAVVINDKVDHLNATLIDAQAHISAMQHQWDLLSQVENKTTKGMAKIYVQLDELYTDTSNFAKFVPQMIFTGSKIAHLYKQSGDDLKTLTHFCRKKNMIETSSLASLMNMPMFRELKTEQTNIESIERVDNNSIKIEFTAPYESEHVQILRVHSFDYWVNLTSQPVLMKYQGPEYVIHNATSNCTKGVEVTFSNQITDTCIQTNHTDPKMKLWQPVESIVEPRNQIITTRTHVYLYCLFNNYTIYNNTYRCPPYVMKFPISTPLISTNLTHLVNVVRLNSTTTISGVLARHFNLTEHRDDFQDNLELVSQIRNLNRHIQEISSSSEKQVFNWKLPDLWDHLTVTNLLTLLSITLMLMSFACMCRSGGADRHREGAHNESITFVAPPGPSINICTDQLPMGHIVKTEPIYGNLIRTNLSGSSG